MKYINLDYINGITDGDNELLNELSDIFISQIDEIVDILNESMEKKDFTTLKQAAHKIKSSLRTFGVKDLATRFEEVELSRDVNFSEEFNEIIKNMINEVNSVVSELEVYLSQHK